MRGAYGDAAVSSIHPRDIAAIGAKALLDPQHTGRAYALKGPQSLTQRDQIRLIGEAIGVELSWQEISAEHARQTMLAQRVSEEIPDRMLGYLAECLRQPGPVDAGRRTDPGSPCTLLRPMDNRKRRQILQLTRNQFRMGQARIVPLPSITRNTSAKTDLFDGVSPVDTS